VREQEGKTGPAWRDAGGGGCTSGRQEKVGKWWRVNMVQILCTNVLNGKMVLVETLPGIGVRGMKENGGGGEFKYNIFDVL
jgi:hypothetical protein